MLTKKPEIKPVYSNLDLERKFTQDTAFQSECIDVLKKYLTARAEHREQIRILESQFENLNKFVKNTMLDHGVTEFNGLRLEKYLNGYYLKSE